MRAMDAEKLSLAAPAAGYAPWGTIDGLGDTLVIGANTGTAEEKVLGT